MKQAFYIDEHGTRHILEIPENAENLTESLNSSRTVKALLEQTEEQRKQNEEQRKQNEEQRKQNEEQRKENKRAFWLSFVGTLVSIGALIVSIFALFLNNTPGCH